MAVATFTDSGRVALATYLVNAAVGVIPTHFAIGTGTTAENRNQTALVTEVETRSGVSRALALTTVANDTCRITASPITLTAARTIAEVGSFSQLGVGGTMFVRSTFTGIALAINDTVAATIDIVFG